MGLDLYIFAAQAYANIDEVDDAYDDLPENSTGSDKEDGDDEHMYPPDTFRSFGPPRLPRTLPSRFIDLIDVPDSFMPDKH